MTSRNTTNKKVTKPNQKLARGVTGVDASIKEVSIMIAVTWVELPHLESAIYSAGNENRNMHTLNCSVWFKGG